MSTPRNPLSLARRWTAGVLLASTLGAGAVGVHLAQDRGTATAGASSTASVSGADGSGTSSSGSAAGSSSSSSSDSSGSSFSAVPGVSPGTGSAQSSTSGS